MSDPDPTSIQYRPARRSECRTIASLYSISSDGLADYIWTKRAEPEESILDVGQRRYEQEDSVFSYRNCTVAVSGEAIAGMLVAFPIFVNPDEKEEDPILAAYSRLEENNSYYVCGVALFPEYRGKGIGTRLMDLAEKHAREQGFNKVSLLVFEENKGAKRLYDRLGFREVMREPVVSHPLIHVTGDVILMVKELD